MVKFIESSHQYMLEDGEELISVSKFTELFKEKQNWDEIARKRAKKLGVSAKELRDSWKEKARIATEVGTLLHSIRETELIHESDPVFYDSICQVKQCEFKEGDKYSIPINALEDNTVYPELMIYDLDHSLCGQADKIIVSNGKIHVWDYKTDKEIAFQGYSNKFMKARKLLKPLDHLDECNANIYSVKMSLYMYMLWKANKGKLKPGDLIIEHVHLKRDEEGIPILENGLPVVLKTEKIKLPYRKKEVEEMLKTIV